MRLRCSNRDRRSPGPLLVLTANQPLPLIAQRLRASLPDEPFDLAPIGDDLAVLTFLGRTIPPASAQSKGPAVARFAEALATAANVPQIIPDLPLPGTPAHRDTAPEGLEGIWDFPPGCWADREPDLKGRPRWAMEAIRAPRSLRVFRAAGSPFARGDRTTIRSLTPEAFCHAQVPPAD